ncbi:SDR family NAD(P)-dependent oxidoreductase [Vibrio sp. SCSIO 43135]|uniref:SDR family oxidoreductase n=1 Tax=Vibrio sp. SCSIO 43135 TaxID=2819096 RepID=UPI0020754FC5|nr:SDR family NAD(P)-dependent oxidoreductase [Vibrio sp. SCSIO 43135]USD42730.1 SDR family NAD(P)-dependent oxidoreductase [Vibrio sp. SCSIO 43135]
MELTNKTILITGGTSGIGLHLVEQLCTGNRVVIAGRDLEKLRQLELNYGVETCWVDLAVIESVEKLAQTIENQHSHIDVLINNAAVQYTPTFDSDDFHYQTIVREITTNFTSVCCLTYLLLPLLRKSDSATVLNVNSGLALTPKKGSAVYCATKSALSTFSTSLSYQLAELNIKVLQAFLPVVDTPMTYGRGKSKMSAERAAQKIIHGIKAEQKANDIGKVKLLRWLLRFFPAMAYRIMRNA